VHPRKDGDEECMQEVPRMHKKLEEVVRLLGRVIHVVRRRGTRREKGGHGWVDDCCCQIVTTIIFFEQ